MLFGAFDCKRVCEFLNVFDHLVCWLGIVYNVCISHIVRWCLVWGLLVHLHGFLWVFNFFQLLSPNMVARRVKLIHLFGRFWMEDLRELIFSVELSDNLLRYNSDSLPFLEDK